MDKLGRAGKAGKADSSKASSTPSWVQYRVQNESGDANDGQRKLGLIGSPIRRHLIKADSFFSLGSPSFFLVRLKSRIAPNRMSISVDFFICGVEMYIVKICYCWS